jgi:hypothetical protein
MTAHRAGKDEDLVTRREAVEANCSPLFGAAGFRRPSPRESGHYFFLETLQSLIHRTEKPADLRNRAVLTIEKQTTAVLVLELLAVLPSAALSGFA